jgi:hypothetical protein
VLFLVHLSLNVSGRAAALRYISIEGPMFIRLGASEFAA